MHESVTGLVDVIGRAEILKSIAHPVRIKILEELLDGVECVSDFEEFLDVSQPNLSLNLSVLKRYRIIDYFIDGRLRCHFLGDPIVPDVLELLKKEYSGDLPPSVLSGNEKGKISRGTA